MRIVLNLLVHENNGNLQNLYFPLSIGLVSEYLKASIKNLETFLFKKPSLLKTNLENHKPDIVMFGNYMWIEKLNCQYAEWIKSLYPKTLGQATLF